MKTAFFLLATVAFLQNQWEEHTDLDGRFRIMAPGRFEQKIDSVETAVGRLANHTFYLQTKEQEATNLFYIVSYTDYPAGIFETDTTGLAEEFLQTTIAASAENVGGQVVYEADFPLGQHPGKQWRVDYLGGKAVIKSRAYLVGSRIYALRTIAWKEKSLNADANRFLDSFKLL